ncbi:SSU ribosomal protein S1P [Candidatus Pelagibacter ubique]|uniref:SSU ribosomal protein S1P n=1 Tax=Pelagibacter ubique TaxID=198252 RepID=A0ABX1T332_PELUQ|nr:S1 RNA-binding domain-containing protein [Candidatus Pelagibacter ubique]NMN67484.1 SSU ribosomal protein S1P [Candidatus Pelagibacter ubique]
MFFKNKTNYEYETKSLMEIYKDLSNPASKEFEKLLNSQFTKTANLEEGKIIAGVVNKVTENFVFLEVPGLKSEPILDINELKSMGMLDKAKVGEKISVLLERLEDKKGEVLVSASKAMKIAGWESLVASYDKGETVMGKITGRVKGGCIVEHIDTGSLMFLPGSQISDKPLKDITHLMNEPQKFALIKLDRQRGNVCCSRREVISTFKKEDKIKIVEKFKVGDLIKGAEVKGYSSFGCFFNVNGELDVLVHLQEISYSRVNHPDEVFTIGEKHDLKVISVDLEKLQVGCSVKQLTPDPFENISNYELNKTYKVKVVKLMDFGAFCELEKGLSTLLHSSELSWTKKNVSAKKMLKVNDEIDCVITEIDKEKRRVAISHRLTTENPFKAFEKKVGSEVEGIVSSKNEYSIFLKVDGLDIDAFLHCNDLTYLTNAEEELAKYKIGDKLKVKVLEVKSDEQKVRVGLRQTQPDPFDWFKGKKVKDTITVKVISTDNKGLVVRPVGMEMDFVIKKSQIAVAAADQRSTRWTGNESVDCAIAELDFEKRKAVLSIKLLEEIDRKVALDTYGSEASGKNLPFSSLSDDLKKKKKED